MVQHTLNMYCTCMNTSNSAINQPFHSYFSTLQPQLNNVIIINKTVYSTCSAKKKQNEYVTIAVNRNLSNCEKARKKDFGASTGFEPVASALALQCSTSLSYEDPYTGGRPIY